MNAPLPKKGASNHRVSVDLARRLISLATRAPSVHNTQPWVWRLRDDRLELYADWTRRLEVTDPHGRNLVMSCGAALHHLRVAASAIGWDPIVTRVADSSDPSLLAWVRLSPAPRPPSAESDLRAIRERCTDHRRFTSWPVPDERLARLAAIAHDQGSHATALTDLADRLRVESLHSRAHLLQGRNRSVATEADRWADRPVHDGGAFSRLPGPGLLEDDRGDDIEGGDGLVLLHDTDDSPMAWLRAGESLSALWLHVASQGLSIVPLSQVVEVDETRDVLQHQVLGGLAAPMLLIRVGWQAIGRSRLEATPRRPVADVLLL
ncbi:MAG: hypothetical protein ABIO16_08430 [Nocardioides sp.]